MGMEVKDQVCTLEQAKKLKELGVKQEALWFWVYPTKESMISSGLDIYYHLQAKDIIGDNEGDEFDNSMASAFGVAELGVIMPDEIFKNDWCYTLRCDKRDDNWTVNYTAESETSEWGINDINGFTEKNEASARSQMLIYLLENNLIDKTTINT